jgi:hypothetical protein
MPAAMRTSLVAVAMCASLLAGCFTTLGAAVGGGVDIARSSPTRKPSETGLAVGVVTGVALDLMVVAAVVGFNSQNRHESDHSGW